MPKFQSVPRVLTGCGCVSALGAEAARLGRKALLVTGRTAMREHGFTQRILEMLRSAGVDTVTFDHVEAEPASPTIDRGRQVARENSCDVVICLGGGSAIDAGKAIAALFNEEHRTELYVRGLEVRLGGLPCIAIPTTSGTGSEVTNNSVITLPDDRTKKSIRGEALLPALAVVDPELTVPLPPDITAATGMDALTQAIESYASIHATPLTQALSFDAAIMLTRNVEAAFRDGADLAAREACSYGSLMAGMALANARLGVVHGIVHPVGARYHVPHGLACAILLPHAMRLNRAFAEEKFNSLSNALGCDVIEYIERLLGRLGIPPTLRDFGLSNADFDEIVEQSLPSGSLKANPKKIEPEDVRKLLAAVL